MRGPSACRFLATCLIPSAPSTHRNRTAALKLAMPLAALLLGVAAPAYTQAQTKPVPHLSVMRPSSAPPESLAQLPPRIITQANLTPVNTGPGVVFTCDANVAAATCTYLNTTVAGYYNATFTNANANIYIQYGATGLGGSTYYYNFVTYSQYVTGYGNIANKSAIQTSAQSALSTYDATPYGSDYVWIQPGIARALGITAQVQGGVVGGGLPALGIMNTTSGVTYCTAGTAGCYDGIVTVTNSAGVTLYYDNLGGSEPAGAYDFYAVVMHEADEVLGTSSCISTQGNSLADGCDGEDGNSGSPSAVDLFRYSSAGHLVLDSSLSTTPGAYFSYNGGTTNGANGIAGTPKVYNTVDNGEDYADYISSSPCSTNQAIQDAEGCPGADKGLTILNDGGSIVNILNAVAYSVPSGTSSCTSANPNPNPNPAAFASQGDFNGDCKSDILWRNTSTGEVDMWLMNGTGITSGANLGTVSTAWGIAGAGDLNGDHKSDILWRNSSTGELDIWLMNGTVITNGASLGTIATNWTIAAVGDFNGDGKSDILWRNTSTGEVDMWIMNGTSITSGTNLGTISTAWSVVGAGDFNGDGKADILWRNTSTGEVDLWIMNGASVTSGTNLGTIATNWTISGIGDFNGNGKSDILWRNTSTGEVDMWLMNGTSIASASNLGTVSTAWAIAGTGDLNGDGKADILWRNTSTGEVDIWLMNGTGITSAASVGTIATNWQIATLSP